MEASVELKSNAYYKIMLHCLKHLTSDCYGFLLGKIDHNKYIVSNAIPLSHDKIIGFYENLIVNQMKEEGAISNQSHHICEIISKNSKINPLFFQIYSKDSGEKGEPFLKDEIFFKEFVFNDDNFRFIDNKKETEDEFKQMKEYCQDCRQEDIIDFDDHLENPNLDWRNDFVN